MSEEIMIGGAHFDNNMPKWATEETMKRLGLEFKKDRTVTKKQNEEMISILGKIVQTMNKTSNDSKENKKLLTDLSKQIKESVKTDKEILAELKKTNKSLEKKTSSNNVTTGNISDTEDVVDAVEENTHVLERMHQVLAKMSNDLTSSMGRYSSGIKEASENIKKGNVIRRSQSDGGSGTARMIEDSLSEMVDKLENNKMYTRGARTTSVISNEIDPSRSRTRKFNDGLGSMIAAIGGVVKGFKRITSMVFELIKKIPFIGAKITAATMAISSAMDMHEILTQSFEDYRKMIESGLSFSEELMNGVRMDGIRARRMISEAGLTFKNGLEALQNNIEMINELGVKDYLGTIKDVMGNAQDASAFMNRVMMSQDQIAKFTGMYLSNLKRIGDYERLNSKDRAAGIQSFIKNTKMLSEITGQSIEEISKMLEQATADPRIKVFMAGMEADQRQNIEAGIQAAAAYFGGVESDLYKNLMSAVVDPTNAGLMGTNIGGDLQLLSNLLGGDGELFNALDSVVRDLKSGNVSGADVESRLGNIAESIADRMAGMAENERSAMLRIMQDQNSALYSLVGDAYRMQQRVIMEEEKRTQIRDRMGEQLESSTRLALLEQQKLNTSAQREAAIQFALATAADSAPTRAVMEKAYEGMIYANELGEQAANAAVVAGKTVAEHLPKVSTYLKDMLSIMKGDDPEDREESAKDTLDRSSPERVSELAALSRKNLMDSLRGAELNVGLIDDSRFSHVMKGKFDENMERFNEMGLGIDQLKKDLQSDDTNVVSSARNMLAYLSSTQMKGIISNSDRQEYREALEASISSFDEHAKDVFYEGIERMMKSGSAVEDIITRIRQAAETNEDGSRNTTSRSSVVEENTKPRLEVETKPTRVEETSRRAIEEQERREQEAQEQQRRDRNARQTAAMNSEMQFDENGIPMSISRSAVDNSMNNVTFDSNSDVLVKKVEELIRATVLSSEEQKNLLRNISQTLVQGNNNGSVSS